MRNDARERGPWTQRREEEATLDWMFVIFVPVTVVMVVEALGMSFIRRQNGASRKERAMSRVLCVLGVVVGALALVVSGAAAATSHEAIADVLETHVAVNRTDVMARAVLLPRAEADAFWPVYRNYERERERLEGEARALLDDYLTNAQTLDDATVQAMLDRLFALYEQRLGLVRTYATALQARLPIRHAAAFVQREFELLRLMDFQRDERLGRMR